MDWDAIVPKELLSWFRPLATQVRKANPVVWSPTASGSNAVQWLAPSGRSREERDTVALYREAKRLSASGPFADEAASRQWIIDLIVDICAARRVAPSLPLGSALWDAICDFLTSESLSIQITLEVPPPNLTMEEGYRLRALLRRHIAFLNDHERLLSLVRHKLQVTFAGILEYFPPSAFVDIGENGEALDDSVVLPQAKALALAEKLPEVLDRLAITFFDEDIVAAHLFDHMREMLNANMRVASGILDGKDRPPDLPSEHQNKGREFLVEAYLRGTPMQGFFEAGLPFAIPFPARFEHTHVIGGTGHGKTQLLQFLIHHDLTRAAQDDRSVIVMDSQGDLIRTMSRLGCFAPNHPSGLSDRFVLIDPSDVEHPVALNMFDFNRDRLSGYAPLDREKILNATIELYDYFFGALLGAELTQRQGLIFRYLARLLIEIPGATIHTLRALMDDGEKFLPFMERLTGTARAFFATRFFDASFRETKKQILARLWGVLSNSALERMFSHRQSKIDVFDLMNSGKIVFINTAKDLLGQDGSVIFGRFFVALIAQATIQRSAIPAHERSACFLYIDEAQEYFDRNIETLLSQARKYRVGLVFAHQSLDQLSTELKSSVLSNTTIKFAGGVSARDATVLAAELHTAPEFLRAQSRRETTTSFACFVRNFTGNATSISIPLGLVEQQPRLSDEDAERLIERNREVYSAPPEIVEAAIFTVGRKHVADRAGIAGNTTAAESATVNAPSRPAEDRPEGIPPVSSRSIVSAEAALTSASPPRQPPPVHLTPGKGGQEHKYLQHLVKRLAEERGIRATVEENILSGFGQVDVSLTVGKRKIACEISVTTSRDHELQNVEKCLAAGFTEVVLICATERHSKALAKFITENLDEGPTASIRYLSPEGIPDFLNELANPLQTHTSVRGYRVVTTAERLSVEEAQKRRSVLAAVVAKSLRR